MATYPASAPERGTYLDYETLRASAAEAIKAARLTQAQTAALVAEHTPDRAKPPTVSAISNAVRETGGGVAALQIDILGALTGATFSGPLYRVE